MVEVIKHPHDPAWFVVAQQLLDPSVTDQCAAKYIGERCRGVVRNRYVELRRNSVSGEFFAR